MPLQHLNKMQVLFSAVVLAVALAANTQAADEPKAPAADASIQPAAVNLGRPVDFERDIYPMLDAKCLACHNAAISENGLNLEDIKGILKGGKRGPAVVAKDPEKSWLYRMASRAVKPAMPPLPNKVEAASLTPQEVGLLKQWIIEGAVVSGSASDKKINWQPLPKGIQPIYSLSLTPDGQYAAAGRANHIVIYHVPTGELLAELADPALASIQYNGRPMYDASAAHRDFIHALAFSPNGRTLASGSFREVKLWSRPEAAARLNLAFAAGPVSVVAVSRDEQWVAAATGNLIRLFRLTDGQPGKVLTGHGATVTGLQFAPDGQTVCSTALDQSVRFWNVADGAIKGRIDTPAPIQALAYSADGAKVFVGCADKLIRAFDVPAVAPRQLVAPAAPVASMQVSPDKKWLALAEADGRISLINLATGQPAPPLVGHAGPVTGLSFSADSTRLASSGADKTLRLWNITAPQPLLVLSGSLAPVECVALHPKTTHVAAGTNDGRVALFKLDVAEPRALAGDNGIPATVAAISLDGKQLAIGGTAADKPVVFLRDIASGNITKTLGGHEGPITALAFSADGARLVSGSADKTARVWNLADGAEVAKFIGHTQTVTGVAFNSNAQQAASGAADNSLKLWTVADGKELMNFAGHAGPITGVALAANNQSLISSSADQTIRLWNPGNGQQTGSIGHGQPVTALAISPDGNRIAATGTDQHVKLYQPDGKVLFTLSGHTAAAKSAAFSSDNTRLITGGADNAAMVWDVASGAFLESLPTPAGLTCALPAAANLVLIGAGDKSLVLRPVHFERAFAGNTKAITGLVFTPGGDGLLTASEDGSLRRFQTDNAQPRYAQNHGAAIRDLALSPDGALVATAGDNNQVHVWNANDGGNGPKPVLEGFTAAVRSVCFTPDGQYTVSGAANNLALVHNVKTGAVDQIFAQQAGAIEATATAGDNGRLCISSSADKTIFAWPLSAATQLAGHTGPVTVLALVGPAGAQLASGSDDGSVRHWNLSNGTQVRSVSHGGPVGALAVRPDGLRFASAGAGNVVRLWNGENGQPIAELRGDLRAQRLVARLTADEAEAKALVAAAAAAIPAAEKASTERADAVKKALEAKATAEKAVTEMTAKSLAAAEAAAKAKTAADGNANDQNLAKALADAQKAAADAAAALKTAEMAKIRADEVVAQAEKAAKEAVDAIARAKTDSDAAIARHKEVEAALATSKTAAQEREKPIRALAFSRDGAELAAAGDAGTLHTWDATTGTPFEVIEGHGGPVLSLGYAAGHTLVSGSADQSARVWNLNPPWALAGVLGPKKETPQDLATSVFVDRVLCLDFSPDGALLATGGGEPSRSGEVLIWDVASQALVRSLADAHSDTVFDLEFSRDGRFLLSGAADKFVKIFDVASGKHVKSFEGHTNHVLGVTWRADGKRIASAGADNAIKVWNVDLGEQERTIAGYAKQVTSIRYIGRGNNLISCGGDKTVRFHQGDNGNNFRSFAGATDFMYAAAASENEQIVVAGGQDGVLRVWNGANGQVIRVFDPPKLAEPQQAQAKP